MVRQFNVQSSENVQSVSVPVADLVHAHLQMLVKVLNSTCRWFRGKVVPDLQCSSKLPDTT